jgi:hypothetical protein
VDATVAAVLAAMAEDTESRLARSDAMLARMSWDRTWMAMDSLLVEAAPDLDEEAAGV